MRIKYKLLFTILFLAACATNTTSMETSDPIQVYAKAGSSQVTAVAAISTADYFAH